MNCGMLLSGEWGEYSWAAMGPKFVCQFAYWTTTATRLLRSLAISLRVTRAASRPAFETPCWPSARNTQKPDLSMLNLRGPIDAPRPQRREAPRRRDRQRGPCHADRDGGDFGKRHVGRIDTRARRSKGW